MPTRLRRVAGAACPTCPSPSTIRSSPSGGGRLYVAGGYGGLLGAGDRLRTVFALDAAGWHALPRLPEPRAAGGAAVVGGRLYVVGGVGAPALARRAFALDLRTRRWSASPRRRRASISPSRRPAGGSTRSAGAGRATTRTSRPFEAWAPGARRWERLPSLPRARGGTGAAVVRGELVSVGGEEPAGAIASVYAYRLAARRWRRLPDLPTPRHGLGVAAVGSRVYALAGGPSPGLTVSGANEYLDLGR